MEIKAALMFTDTASAYAVCVRVCVFASLRLTLL